MADEIKAVAWTYRRIDGQAIRENDVIARTPDELGGEIDLYPSAWKREIPLYTAQQLLALVERAMPAAEMLVAVRSLIPGARDNDWAIPTAHGCRVVDARMAHGWNEAREQFLTNLTALVGEMEKTK